MPHSDNLYSANDDESDNESFSNELSPTDGFFNRSSMASSRMVPDPSLDRKHAAEEDKVLIPRSETRNESGSTSRSASSPTLGQLFPSQNYASSQSNSRPPPIPSTSNRPSSPVSRRRTDNDIFSDPRLSMRGPPPAYTPSSPTTSTSNHNRSYSTFEPHHTEQALPTPSNSEPQSMGRPSEDPDERTPLSSNETTKPSWRNRNFLRKFLFVALVFAVVMTLLTGLANLGRSSNDNDDSKLPGGKLPDGTKPPDLGLPDDSSGSYCASATIHKAETLFDFALGDKLALIQETHEGYSGSNTRSVRTSGEVRVKKLPKSSKYRSRGVVSIDTHVSHKSLEILEKWDESLRILRVSVPRSTSVSGNDNCISLEITLWLPEDAIFSDLGISTTMLNLKVFDDIKVKVTNSIQVALISGNANFYDAYYGKTDKVDKVPPTMYPIDSRHISVETISGNIKGVFPLYDTLELRSQSGDIHIGAYPQPLLPSAPAPAELEVSTTSGNIWIELPAQVPGYTPPPRDYVSHVSTVSGETRGNYFLGSVGSFKSSSGDITAKVLPVVQYSPSTDPDDAPKTQFDTFSISGNHDLEILEPVFISLLPSNTPTPPIEPTEPTVPTVPDLPDLPSNPGQHHPPEPYIPIGDDDPYRDILRPELNEDVVLDGTISAKMVKRRRTIAAKKWRTLTATHKSSSADITLRYPEAWEGTVSESTISGDTTIKGKDLKLITYKKGWPYKELIAGKGVAKKGEGSSVSMSSISGDLTFAVGEE